MAGKTLLLSAIRKAIDPKKEALIVHEEYVIIYELDEKAEQQRMKMIFKKAGQRYVEIKLEEVLNLIVEKLAPHLDVKRFLKELLILHSSPQEIVELKERLEKGAKITEAPLCYSLMIGGKRGRPYEFNIVS